MTAIQGNLVSRQAPLHATLAEAQSRFMVTVSEGVEELMRRCGYSRERATSALLRELGSADAPPQDKEVFATMTAYGLGVDDAVQALTVSRAFTAAMKGRRLSAVEAIDDLTSKLSITKLLASGVKEPKEPDLPSRPCSPEHRRPTTPTTSTNDRHCNNHHKGRKANAKPVLKNTSKKVSKGTNTKNQSRKRPAIPNDETKQGESVKFSSRARADSVSEAVEAKAKKARISPEEASPSESPPPPIIVRSKRTAAHFEQEPQSSNI